MKRTPLGGDRGNYPRFVREWIGANGLEQSDGADSITYNPKTRHIIEERFKGMEWSNDPAKVSFTIELDAERSLQFRSESAESKDQQEFSTIWTRPGPMIGGATSAIVKRSRQIPNAEKALELLHTYLTTDGDIQSAAEWDE